MHAISALLGETVEWKESNSRKNFIEEAGDIEFYIEAAYQNMPIDRTVTTMYKVDRRAQHLTMGTVFDNVCSIANDLFDQTKKSWVYGKALDKQVMEDLLMGLRANLNFAYELFSTSAEEVTLANKLKLIGPGGRFESGFYSDAQAIARKDKMTGEPLDPLAPDAFERKFIGKSVA